MERYKLVGANWYESRSFLNVIGLHQQGTSDRSWMGVIRRASSAPADPLEGTPDYYAHGGHKMEEFIAVN